MENCLYTDAFPPCRSPDRLDVVGVEADIAAMVPATTGAPGRV